jgi:hypothetical protein
MSAKDPERRRATNRASYARTKHLLTNEERVRRTAVKRARRDALAEWFEQFKSGLACARCGEAHPGVLQFHHRDPQEKEISVSEAISAGWSRERILCEAKKCEVLCANCHMKHHAREGHDVD